ncbi:carbon storage regulator [Leptolyngbya sp. 15MV]|nr:carbon storage regulator [Leptolyngbya sp. 15MV]
MLVITRREGEEVVIGDPRNPIGIVRVASIKGDRVRVAFDFPRSIEVHRREIADQITGSGSERAPAGASAGRDAGAEERAGRITGEVEIHVSALRAMGLQADPAHNGTGTNGHNGNGHSASPSIDAARR